MKLRVPALAVLFVVLGLPVFAADLTVPDFQLITRGYYESGSVQLDTLGKMDLRVGGGYKFGGNILFGLSSSSTSSTDLADFGLDAHPTLSFNGANLTIRELFKSPLDLTYFTGYYDAFANGTAFPAYFGTAPIASHFRGFYYFPDQSTNDYYDNGIYRVEGTGLELSVPHLAKWLDTAVYAYQDSKLGKGFYGSDVRTLLNFDHFKVDAFAGASFPQSLYGLYRAGALIYYNTGSGGEFLTEIGVPEWDPSTKLTIEDFYLLFEPRVTFGSFSIIPTLFWHPGYDRIDKLSDVPTANVNLDFGFGNPDKSPATGGFETELTYLGTPQPTKANPTPQITNPITVSVSPYFRLVAAGVVWNFKVRADVYSSSVSPTTIVQSIQGFFGVETQF